MRRDLMYVLAAAAVLILGAWAATSANLRARVSGQLQLGTAPADSSPAAAAAPPAGPPSWKPHVPANAWTGKHRMYHHPASCSPNLNTPQAIAYDWMFSPPAQGDL